ncbi:hypothetical protein BN14_06610 [Rhizoctonia solani AG-1 IB]|uniref:Uncharacterized protein n=1 Tax=Thanatephorus cucumeris (strain AG1-IB / isolate 7/3/14) TaxID=1108050 RepID=M5BY30_THACB|nr:hypothetical protein BN14_06610 [Rhizoctonia solani AG-1 IB]
MASETIAIEGDYAISLDFTWKPEFEAVLDTIAETNMVDIEWDDLRDMLKHKLVQNLSRTQSKKLRLLLHPPPLMPHLFP